MGWARRTPTRVAAAVAATAMAASTPGCRHIGPPGAATPEEAAVAIDAHASAIGSGGEAARADFGGTRIDAEAARHDADDGPGAAAPPVENAPTAAPPDDAPSPPSALDPHGGPHDGRPVASRYAALDRASCEAELDRRHIAFERVDEARGVVAPLRLAGPLSGVTFRSNLPPSKSRTSPYDIYDCRLVLALDDFARVLTKYDIIEVVHLSVYRPPPAKARLRGAGRRHGGALAIDAAVFKTKSGRTLSVAKDYRGRRGVRPCPAPPSSSTLRKIACEASAARLFNVLLTPGYNRAHRNHLHLEVTAGVNWTFVR